MPALDANNTHQCENDAYSRFDGLEFIFSVRKALAKEGISLNTSRPAFFDERDPANETEWLMLTSWLEMLTPAEREIAHTEMIDLMLERVGNTKEMKGSPEHPGLPGYQKRAIRLAEALVHWGCLDNLNFAIGEAKHYSGFSIHTPDGRMGFLSIEFTEVERFGVQSASPECDGENNGVSASVRWGASGAKHTSYQANSISELAQEIAEKEFGVKPYGLRAQQQQQVAQAQDVDSL